MVVRVMTDNSQLGRGSSGCGERAEHTSLSKAAFHYVKLPKLSFTVPAKFMFPEKRWMEKNAQGK